MNDVGAGPARASRPNPARKRQRVFEVVCDDIRHQVGRGFLRPGDKLPAERDLAERLGVSRTAVREALRSLEASGILEFRKGVLGGAFIREPSSTGVRASLSDMLALGRISLEHLSETRSSLLIQAAGLACERGTDEDFDRIEHNLVKLDSMDRNRDRPEIINEVAEFYVLIGNASHNGVLKILIEAVTDVARELLVRIRVDISPDLGARRRLILDALRARDAKRAERLMAQHMAEAHAYVAAHGGGEALKKARSS